MKIYSNIKNLTNIKNTFKGTVNLLGINFKNQIINDKKIKDVPKQTEPSARFMSELKKSGKVFVQEKKLHEEVNKAEQSLNKRYEKSINPNGLSTDQRIESLSNRLERLRRLE